MPCPQGRGASPASLITWLAWWRQLRGRGRFTGETRRVPRTTCLSQDAAFLDVRPEEGGAGGGLTPTTWAGFHGAVFSRRHPCLRARVLTWVPTCVLVQPPPRTCRPQLPRVGACPWGEPPAPHHLPRRTQTHVCVLLPEPPRGPAALAGGGGSRERPVAWGPSLLHPAFACDKASSGPCNPP